MAYRLKPSDTVEHEVRRIAAQQLEMALAELGAASSRRGDDAVHAARRHVKKVRALGRLVQQALGPSFPSTNKGLRAVGGMLAPITDGEAVVDTLTRLRKTSGDQLSRHTFSAIRANLLRRKRRLATKAAADRVPQTAARLLRDEQQAVRSWTLTVGGFRAVAPGLKRTYRRARKAMARAIEHPTTDNFHTWRRRVKDHWFQLRLLERRCNRQLLSDQERLEVLDGCLGEYHNCVILQRVVMTETLDSREETAHFLRLLRRYQRELRRQAYAIGAQAYKEQPRPFIATVRRHWRAAARARISAEVQVQWPRSA